MLTQEKTATVIDSIADASALSSQEVARQQRLMQTMKEDQQQKYLHLQEQAESLLQQLIEMKQQREQVESRQLVGSAAR